jgi:hypothetical protein
MFNKKIISGVLIILVSFIFLSACGKKEEEVVPPKKEEPKEVVDIIDINSKTRPLAIVVNNTPVAVKVQEGLNKAYIIYELPTEGFTSRLLALFKDVKELNVGTIRSARHNFIDLAWESNAIYCAYGWSHYAEDQLKAGAINYLQGIVGDKGYWRENPENLASEHTVFSDIKYLKEGCERKGYSMTTEDPASTIVLNYSTTDVDISKREGAIEANEVYIPYGGSFNTKFVYDSENKIYNRFEDGNPNVDYYTKEQFNTKNIIVEKITYNMCDDNYYWNLHTTDGGEGYFITNGYAVPIKWSKPGRNEKTKFTYLDGTEVQVSDGRTYIEIQTTKQETTIK